ncbi:MAG TPA: response regulator [Parapedobacter sp.]|uniref:response regulator n=1 Tax=Parapedobacter sp. TaxID=1958893 RepID=UPI002C62513D|nr:response regulator [Parapedobacter sp.]HWK59092.1 response regulator [Parapedobacter sp.]
MKRIVLIEDDDAIRDIFQIVFTANDIELVSFENGDKIVDNDIDAPDLFILDKQISGTDGLEVCRFIKNSQKYKNVPVLMLSANPDIIKLAQEAGADGAIPKPFSLQPMRETVLSFIK